MSKQAEHQSAATRFRRPGQPPVPPVGLAGIYPLHHLPVVLSGEINIFCAAIDNRRRSLGPGLPEIDFTDAEVRAYKMLGTRIVKALGYSLDDPYVQKIMIQHLKNCFKADHINLEGEVVFGNTYDAWKTPSASYLAMMEQFENLDGDWEQAKPLLVALDTREARIVVRALRDSLNKKMAPWWSHVTKTNWARGSSDRKLMQLSGEGARALSRRVIIADIVDVNGNTSVDEIGNWCIGLDLYDDAAKVPEFAKGWDNGWSSICIKSAPKLEWDAGTQSWVPLLEDAAL